MSEKNYTQFEAGEEAKSQAMRMRIFAFILWIIAIGAEVYAIMNLLHNEKLTWLIAAIVGILIFAVVGSILWKKANRLDPASEAQPVKFFVQNQLGAIMAVLAFLPLVIFIFTDKNLDKRSKSIAGAVGVIALLVAGLSGADFNPPSVEKYTEEMNSQKQEVVDLIGNDLVFWATNGKVLHLYDDCQYIRNRDYYSGSVEDAWNVRKIGDNEICKVCRKKVTNQSDSLSPESEDETELAEELTE